MRSKPTPKSWSITSGTEARRDRRTSIVEMESVMIPAMESVFQPHLRGCALRLKVCDLFCGRRVVRSFAIMGVYSSTAEVAGGSLRRGAERKDQVDVSEGFGEKRDHTSMPTRAQARIDGRLGVGFNSGLCKTVCHLARANLGS